MKVGVLAFALACTAGWVGCANEAPPRSPPTTGVTMGVTAAQPSNDPSRGLDGAECRSLGDWLRDACNDRPNERSERVDGWCNDILRGVESGSWVTSDCLKHLTYIDSRCFRSTKNVHNLMQCEESVARP